MGRPAGAALPRFILAAYGANVIVFLALVATRYPAMFATTAPQFGAFALMLVLNAYGAFVRPGAK